MVVYLEGCSTAKDPQSSLGTGDGNIHAPDVCHKANASLQARLTGTHTRHDDYIHLLALEAVHCLNDHLNMTAGTLLSNVQLFPV